MNILVKLFGGFTDEEFSRMHSCFCKRFQDEYDGKKILEGKFLKLRKIALDVATKYNDLEKADEILKIGELK